MDPDHLFFECLDPFFHYKAAYAISRIGDADPSVYYSNSDQESDKRVFEIGRMQKAAQIRLVRYTQAETLLTIICSGVSRLPYLKFSSGKFRDLHAAFKDISLSIAPKFDAMRTSRIASFDEFIEYSIVRRHKFLDNISEFSEFISAEANFWCDRSSYNAYKHGCAVTGEKILSIDIDGIGDIDSLLGLDGDCLTSFRWVKEKSPDKEGVEVYNRKIDMKSDLTRILISSIIVNFVRDIRVCEKNKDCSHKVNVPFGFNLMSEHNIYSKLRFYANS